MSAEIYPHMPHCLAAGPNRNIKRHGELLPTELRELLTDVDLPCDLSIDLSNFPSDEIPIEMVRLELNLWLKLLNWPRVRNYELFSSTGRLVHADELTQLFYALTAAFRVAYPMYADRRLSTPFYMIPDEHIALLHGLGFNHILLKIGQEEMDDLGPLKALVAALRQFEIDRVGVQIILAGGLEYLAGCVHQVKGTVAPDYIRVGEDYPGAEVFHVGILDKPACSELGVNQIGIGPNARSRFGNIWLRNIASVEHYLSTLKEQRLPLHFTSSSAYPL